MKTAWGNQIERDERREQRRGFTSARRLGFSLIDLLVSIAVMSVLIGIMLPLLSGVRERARQVVCANNVRQIGYGLQMFAHDNNDLLPDSLATESGDPGARFMLPETDSAAPLAMNGWNPHESLTLRLDHEDRRDFGVTWDGLGILYDEYFLRSPEVFYCPSERGANSYAESRDLWDSENEHELIEGNYQYRLPPESQQLSRVSPDRTLVANALRSQDEYSHVVGNNLLKADLRVTWYKDEGGSLFQSLAPSTNQITEMITGVTRGWEILDFGNPEERWETPSYGTGLPQHGNGDHDHNMPLLELFTR
ncbi:MAG: type II secretion system protein [Planctomycetota bacterium]